MNEAWNKAFQNRFKAIKKTVVKKEDMPHVKGYEIIVDKKKYKVSTDTPSGKLIKVLAGITERDEAVAKSVYAEWSDTMGWFAYCLECDDEPLLDKDEILICDWGNEFYTACNGTYIIEDAIEKEKK